MFEVGPIKKVCAFFVSFCMKPLIFKFKFDPIYFYCGNTINPCHNNPHAFLSRIPGMPNTSNLITKSSFEKCDSRIGIDGIKVRSFILPELPGILNSVHTSRPQNLKLTKKKN